MLVTNCAPPGIRHINAFGNQDFLNATKQIRDEFKDLGYEINEGITTEVDGGRIFISLNEPTETGIELIVINVHNDELIADETPHSERNVEYLNIRVTNLYLQSKVWELIRRLDSELPEFLHGIS